MTHALELNRGEPWSLSTQQLQLFRHTAPEWHHGQLTGTQDSLDVLPSCRYFIERFHQVVSTPYFNLLLHGSSGSAQCILVGIREIQKLLQKRGGPLAFGSTYSMADCGVAPFVGRIFATGRAGLLSGDVYQKLTTDPEFAPFKAYHEALTSRPSWNATFDEDYIVNGTKKRVEASRAQAKANKKE